MYVQAPQYQTLQQLKQGSGKSISQLLREAICGNKSVQSASSRRDRVTGNDATPIDCLPSSTHPSASAAVSAHVQSAAGEIRPQCLAQPTVEEIRHDLEQVASLTARIAQQPNSVTLWIQRGLFHMNLKRYPEAAADFSAAIQLSPRLAQAYYKRSQAYYMLGKEQQAAQDRQLAKQLFSGESWC